MHKCNFKGCSNIIDNKYYYCYEHKNNKYISFCKIHGKTIFKDNKCVKCENMKIPVYEIKKVKNKWYDKDNKLINKQHKLFLYIKRLSTYNRKYQEKYISKPKAIPGIYGIFVRDKRKKNKLGRCLYIGQSVNILNRVHQHKECFKKAKYHIASAKRHHKRVKVEEYKVESKYYNMAKKYSLSELVFKAILVLPEGWTDKEYKEYLTYGEQAMMFAFKPLYNTYAARPTIQK